MDVELIDDFRYVYEHFLTREGRLNDKKINVYFLAEYHNQTYCIQESEISEIVLLGYHEALRSLTSKELKIGLKMAEEFLNDARKRE